jgi:Domain of unknown function (DUF4037)
MTPAMSWRWGREAAPAAAASATPDHGPATRTGRQGRSAARGGEKELTLRPGQGRMTGMAAAFTPGLELARQFYAGVVRPLLEEISPGLRYSAALLGPGSEVLGFDTARSTDHDWGPRLQIFLASAGTAGDEARIAGALAERLPASFGPYPTRFPLSGEPPSAARHHVVVAELGRWLHDQLGFDPQRAISTLDWLATPAQRLAEVTGGALFHDGLGLLGPIRDRLAWYPRDVWCHLLACQWHRMDQEEPFAGRCGEVGDELGSAVITARLARDLMRLCLLMDRRYPPYSKWLGTAFARSAAGPVVGPPLTAALSAAGWRSREQHLSEAVQAAAVLHNQLGLTAPLPTSVRPFYDRPYLVLGSDRFAAALRETIADPCVRDLPLAGAVDQFIDSTDALGDRGALRDAVAAMLHLAS